MNGEFISNLEKAVREVIKSRRPVISHPEVLPLQVFVRHVTFTKL